MPKEKSQIDKFKDAARDLDCDDSEEHFRKRLGDLVRGSAKKDTENKREDEA